MLALHFLNLHNDSTARSDTIFNYWVFWHDACLHSWVYALSKAAGPSRACIFQTKEINTVLGHVMDVVVVVFAVSRMPARSKWLDSILKFKRTLTLSCLKESTFYKTGTEAFACPVGLCMLPSVYKIQEKENFVLSCLEIKTGWYKYVCFVTH